MSVATDTIQRGIDNLRSAGYGDGNFTERCCLSLLAEIKEMVERSERESLSAEPGKAKIIQALTNRINSAGEVICRESLGTMDLEDGCGMVRDVMYTGFDTITLKFKPKGQPTNAIDPSKVGSKSPDLAQQERDRAVASYYAKNPAYFPNLQELQAIERATFPALVINGHHRAAAAGVAIFSEEGTECGGVGVIGTALHDSTPDPDNPELHRVTVSLGWPGMQPCCTPSAEKRAPEPVTAARREGARLLEHDRRNCPDCCLGLTGWLPCEKHPDPVVNPG